MKEQTYLACDFSGIQRYVLAIRTAGKAQAKRLRARSFLLELCEQAALFEIKKRLNVANDDVLSSGGGGFLVRISLNTALVELDKKLDEIGVFLQQELWEETGGEVQVSLGHGVDPMDARKCLEYRKRRPASSVLQYTEGWCTVNRPGFTGDPISWEN